MKWTVWNTERHSEITDGSTHGVLHFWFCNIWKDGIWEDVLHEVRVISEHYSYLVDVFVVGFWKSQSATEGSPFRTLILNVFDCFLDERCLWHVVLHALEVTSSDVDTGSERRWKRCLSARDPLTFGWSDSIPEVFWTLSEASNSFLSRLDGSENTSSSANVHCW